MEFSKIKYSPHHGVALEWTIKTSEEITSSEMESTVEPLEDLPAALAAFTDYVVDLIGAPEWKDAITVTGLSLSKTKDGRRGLIVTATKPISLASDRPLVLNMPLMTERGENTSDEATGVFGAHITALIVAAENAATRYKHGERAQTEIFPVGEQPDRESEGEGTATSSTDGTATGSPKRRQKPKAGKDFIPGVGEVQNPDTVEMTHLRMRKQLLDAGYDCPLDAITGWISSERDAVNRWLRNGQKTEQPPACVQRDATPSFDSQQS